MQMPSVLIACEESAVLRDRFNAAGFNAWSCDLKPSRGRQANHLCGDVRYALDGHLQHYDAIDMRTGHKPLFRRWDMMIAHPPCQYLSVSGLHWNHRRPERAALTEEALRFAAVLFKADIPHVCIENPVSCISSRIKRPTQIIQPYEFGDDASKKTCLWLKQLPKLTPTKRVPGRIVECNGKRVERWSNQTDSGQNRLGPSELRATMRAETYPGIADAMVSQWKHFFLSGGTL